MEATIECPKCNTELNITKAWTPNNLDKRIHAECPDCGWEADDEFDRYFMPDKEVIIAEADGSRYIHGEVYEITFYNEEAHYDSIIGVKYSWKGPVKITIERIKDENSV